MVARKAYRLITFIALIALIALITAITAIKAMKGGAVVRNEAISSIIYPQ